MGPSLVDDFLDDSPPTSAPSSQARRNFQRQLVSYRRPPSSFIRAPRRLEACTELRELRDRLATSTSAPALKTSRRPCQSAEQLLLQDRAHRIAMNSMHSDLNLLKAKVDTCLDAKKKK